jgi:hypothetical protein
MDRIRPVRHPRWLSTLDCARSIGVSDWWVRERIETGLLPALAIQTGRRKIYRVLASDWAVFRARYTGDPRDPRFDRP